MIDQVRHYAWYAMYVLLFDIAVTGLWPKQAGWIKRWVGTILFVVLNVAVTLALGMITVLEAYLRYYKLEPWQHVFFSAMSLYIWLWVLTKWHPKSKRNTAPAEMSIEEVKKFLRDSESFDAVHCTEAIDLILNDSIQALPGWFVQAYRQNQIAINTDVPYQDYQIYLGRGRIAHHNDWIVQLSSGLHAIPSKVFVECCRRTIETGESQALPIPINPYDYTNAGDDKF